MQLWVLFALFALITAAVVVAVTRPLRRTSPLTADAAEPDVAIYRDQLKEIESDRERGLIDGAEAEAARAEVARRLLLRAGGDMAQTSPALQASTGIGRPAALAAAGFISVASVVVYAVLGSPGLPDLPHSVRVAQVHGKPSLENLVVQVEARLRAKPDDGQGWDVVAPVYMMQKRFGDAADAYGRAIKLLGESPKRLAGLAEASVRASDGTVTEPARRAFERLLALDPGRFEARFWLAMAKEQQGKLDDAVADYRALLADAPQDATWKSVVEERLKEIAGGSAESATGSPKPAPATAGEPATGGGKGPPVDAGAVSAMTPAEQQAFIGRMVDGLAERLKANGKDLDGWQRLVRAYKVLGRQDAAVAALADARKNFAGDAAAQTMLDELARNLGLGS